MIGPDCPARAAAGTAAHPSTFTHCTLNRISKLQFSRRGKGDTYICDVHTWGMEVYPKRSCTGMLQMVDPIQIQDPPITHFRKRDLRLNMDHKSFPKSFTQKGGWMDVFFRMTERKF